MLIFTPLHRSFCDAFEICYHLFSLIVANGRTVSEIAAFEVPDRDVFMARLQIDSESIVSGKTKLNDSFFASEQVVRVLGQEEITRKYGHMYTKEVCATAFPGKSWKPRDKGGRRDRIGHLTLFIKVYDQADGVYAFVENQKDSRVYKRVLDDGSLAVTEDQQAKFFAKTIEHTHSDALAMSHRKKALTTQDLDDEAQAKKKARIRKKEIIGQVKQGKVRNDLPPTCWIYLLWQRFRRMDAFQILT